MIECLRTFKRKQKSLGIGKLHLTKNVHHFYVHHFFGCVTFFLVVAFLIFLLFFVFFVVVVEMCDFVVVVLVVGYITIKAAKTGITYSDMKHSFKAYLSTFSNIYK